MMQQIKQILPGGWQKTRRALGLDAARWRRLRVGQTICFGAMEQKELNHARLPVIGSKEYGFPQGSFTAFRMQAQGKAPVWLIVAEAEGTFPYLAISRKLSAHDLENLLAEEDLRTLTHSSRLKRLFLREYTPGMREWITMRYDRRIEGIRGTQNEEDTERVFEYELYVNEDNTHAVEVERYLDGHMDVYATIYRPISDVLDITDAPRRLAEEKPADAVAEKLTAASPQKPRPRQQGQEASLKDVEETRKLMRTRSEPRKETSSSAPENRLECNLPTAWRLIDEALRGGLKLSDVVRRVLGLPLHTSETIGFEMDLSEDDYRLLSERFGLHPSDHASIRARVVKELEAFAGKGPR